MEMAMKTIELDENQLKVVEIDIQDRQVVAAGPGTGKTQVLAELAAELAHNYSGYEDSAHDIDVSQHLLVISFSRAAVDAMRKRTKGDRTLRGLRIQTIDSLAGQILAENGVPVVGLDFDARIVKATEVLRANDPEFIRVLQHVIIDEAQDIVGVRADFVSELLRKLNDSAGFTVLGDINQSIFDFQVAGGIQDDDRFIQKCRAFPRVVGRQLLTQYRAKGEVPLAAMALRKDLINDAARDFETMKTFAQGLEELGDIEDIGSKIGEYMGSTLLLTYSNAVAWRIEQSLRLQGLRVTRRSSAQELGYANWIGHVFAKSRAKEDRIMRKQAFDDTVSSLGFVAAVENTQELWSALRQQIGFQTDAIRTDRLHNLFAQRKLSFEFLSSDPTDVVVSTVHRAKGLEYDNVVLMGPLEWEPKTKGDQHKMSSAEWLSLARNLYVACTRAAHQLKRGAPVKPRGVKKANERLIDGSLSRPRGIEIFPSDFDFFGIDSHLALELGERGTTYTFVLNQGESRYMGYPVIDLQLHGERIARSNERLGKQLSSIGGSLTSVGKLELFGFETQAVSLDSPYYNYGVGVVPRISGILPTTWSK